MTTYLEPRQVGHQPELFPTPPASGPLRLPGPYANNTTDW